MYRHILIATDLSPAAEQVCNRAQQLAQLTGAKLSIVHVIEINFSYSFTYSWPEDLIEELTKEVKAQFLNLGEHYGIDTKDQYIVEGISTVKVLELAKNLNVDCIMVGKKEHNVLHGILGSTASAILRHAEADVLAVVVK